MASSLRLALLMGPASPVPATWAPVPSALADALQSVQVTSTAGQANGFQLTFATSARSVITTQLLPAGFFDPRARVIIVAIVAGTPAVLMDGVVTRQDVGPSDEPGASTLTLTGEDLSVLMDLDHQRACWPAMAPDERAAAICAKYAVYGVIPAVVPLVIPYVAPPNEQIPIQSSTDLAYLKAMASQAGYVFFVNPGPAPGASIAYWGPQVRVGPLQPALTIGMGAATNVESLSFSFDGLSRTQYAITYTEPNSKMSIDIPVPDISLLHPPLAARPAIALRTEPLPDISDLKPAQIALLGLSRTSTSADAVTGQGKLDVLRYGHVLKARELVSVRGAGLAYDGAYYVTSVTHEIKRGEYKQSFSLARDGLVSLTQEVI
jgi:hypothetical protein